jgi:hypothetical protein
MRANLYITLQYTLQKITLLDELHVQVQALFRYLVIVKENKLEEFTDGNGRDNNMLGSTADSKVLVKVLKTMTNTCN